MKRNLYILGFCVALIVVGLGITSVLAGWHATRIAAAFFGAFAAYNFAGNIWALPGWSGWLSWSLFVAGLVFMVRGQ
jgi:nitrogen fixation protein FixH